MRLRLSAEPRAVRVALVRLSAELERQGVAAECAATVELVLAEVLNNVVEHAFPGGASGAIEVAVRLAGATILCEVRDGGLAMPEGRLPEGLLPPSAGRPAAALPEGGFGWFLIRSFADELDYRREGGENVLTFRLPRAAPAPGV